MNKRKYMNAGKGKIIEKINRKARRLWISATRNTPIYKFCYISYWHFLLRPKLIARNRDDLYLAARPNPGAGIGHQLANWIAGYWFANCFGLKFAHIPFSSDEWEEFLGLYQEEETLFDLKRRGFKIVRLQEFDEENVEECERINKIIASYIGQKVVFLAEQDQFYRDQFGVMNVFRNKFFSAPARANDMFRYNKGSFNIALHVRRGDIMENIIDAPSNFSMRYQTNDYFLQALRTALEYLKDKSNIHIYLFSQGEISDFPEFSNIDNLHFCLDMGAQETFLHMVYSDALIISKSSFSYKPALLNRGIKFCPIDFWHSYPKEDDWVLLDEKGKQVTR